MGIRSAVLNWGQTSMTDTLDSVYLEWSLKYVVMADLQNWRMLKINP